jgi:hypothetical protein
MVKSLPSKACRGVAERGDGQKERRREVLPKPLCNELLNGH